MSPDPESAAPRPALPMRLTRLRVKNFRSIADIDIPLSPLTVLVGPNGSGKSNVVDALRFVRDVFARGLDQAVMDRDGMGVIQRWGTEGISVELTISIEKFNDEDVFLDEDNEVQEVVLNYPATDISYRFDIGTSELNSVKVKREILTVNVKDGTDASYLRKEGEFLHEKVGDESWEVVDDGLKYPSSTFATESELQLPVGLFEHSKRNINSFFPGNESFHNVAATNAVYSFDDGVRTALFYNLNPVDFRRPQQLLKETPFDEKGRNLAAVLRRLVRSGGPDWNSLRSTLRQSVVAFDNIEVEAVGGYLATKLLYQTDTSEPRASYLGQESDGTIRMLGLLAALYQEPAQPFISIEEPEANIHPGALAVLAGVLDEASLRSQVLVTTHSPDMLDHLPAESFLVVEKVGDATRVGPLDARQLESVRKRLFTPGELLRMEGLQRQPNPEAAS